jgi:hypothetical protein
MTMPARTRRLLRWYPPAWRSRYQEEFAALLDDAAGDSALSVRLRLNVIRSGVAMRLRDAGISGDGVPPSEWIRGGALVVFCAWSIFVVAGIGLQKTSEHWQDALTGGVARTWATVAFGVVQAVALIASLAVVAGAVVVLPAVARFLAADGWRAVRRRFLWAAAVCGVTAAALAGLALWANRLSGPQRNGTDAAYGLGVLLFAALATASIASVTAAGVATVRRLDLSPAVLRVEGYLAEAVTAAMVVMAMSAWIWWGVVATSAPSFFGGSGPVFNPQMVTVTGFMVGAVTLAVFGTRRVTQGSRRV